MQVLPSFLQPLLTAITGKPRADEWPRLAVPPIAMLAVHLIGSALGACINISLLRSAPLIGIAILPVTWIGLTGTFRRLQVIYLHHLTHRTIFRGRRTNAVAIDVVTTIGLIQNGAEYRADHIPHHRPNVFTSEVDADARFLAELGFLPGRTESDLRKQLGLLWFSVSFQMKFLSSRLRSNFVSPPSHRCMMAACWVLFLLYCASLVDWWPFFLVVFIPMFPLYHLSAMLQLLTEHAWFGGRQPLSRAEVIDRCWGRFCGERCPPEGLSFLPWARAWARWWVRLAFLHVPTRVAVLVGDLPAHDWHHLAGFIGEDGREWPTAIFLREQAIQRGDQVDFRRRELWGLPSMLENAFRRIAQADPLSAGSMPTLLSHDELLQVAS